MPTNKDLKRLVRARMTKTGEAYTAARAQIIKQPKHAIDYALIAGMSDAQLKAKTGCTWERWVHTLDYHGAAQMSHREIAALVRTKYKTPSWWTQTVAVGYERIKGLRARGQQRDGTFGATKSRTYDVPVTTLFEAWRDPHIRRRWLAGDGVKVRSATPPKAMRLDWKDRGVIAVGFTAKGKSKSMVALELRKLPDRATADGLKAFWSDQLDALGETLR